MSYDSDIYTRKTVQKANNGKEYVNYLLVESVMTEKGPRQRTICSLGNLRPRPLGEWLVLARKVEEKLAGQLELEDVESDSLVAEIFEKVKARRSEHLPTEDTASAISVVDRGMALDENLAAIRGRKCRYIVASRQAERNAWLEEFESGDWQEVKRTPSPTNPAQRKSKVLVKRAASGRLKKPEKIWEAIGRIKERYPRVARYYSIEWGETGLK